MPAAVISMNSGFVRISSIDANKSHAYGVQQDFALAMLASMKHDDRVKLTGNFQE